MTILDELTRRALAEFDRLAALREEQVRHAMATRGYAKPEIDAALDECRPGIAEQRRQIGDTVEAALVKQGVPLNAEASTWI